MVALLEAQMKEMNPNLDSIADYRNKVSVYNERVEELNVVTNERDDTKKQYDEWRKRRLDEFMAGFNTISLKLKEMYQLNMILCTFLYCSIDKINYKHLSIHFIKICSFCFSFSKLHFVYRIFI
ncbi:hypothetical protein Hanom_Chr16g01465721 [Helianthus anomalus]